MGHSTKTTFSAVSGIVGLQVAQQDLQRQMQAGALSQQQVRAPPRQLCARAAWQALHDPASVPRLAHPPESPALLPPLRDHPTRRRRL